MFHQWRPTHYEIWKYCQSTIAECKRNYHRISECHTSSIALNFTCYLVMVIFTQHYEIWELCQSTGQVHAEILQNHKVPSSTLTLG